MFKPNDVVVYPIYGCGKIKKIYNETFGTEVKKYYELEFPDVNISISIPVEEAETLGLRVPMKRNEVKEVVKTIWKKVKLSREDVIDLENISKQLLNTGRLEDAVTAVNMIKANEKTKADSNKSLSFSDERNLETAINFIRSEVEHSVGKKAVKELKLENN